MPTNSKIATIVQWNIKTKIGRFVYKGNSVYIEASAFTPSVDNQDLQGKLIEFNPRSIEEQKLDKKPRQRSSIRRTLKHAKLK